MPDPKDTSKTQRLKKILWESTLNAPIRGAYNLMNTPYEVLMGEDSPAKRKAVEDSFDAASGVTVGSAAAPKPRGAITAGFAGKPSKGGLKNIRDTAVRNAKRREAAAIKRDAAAEAKAARAKEKFGPLVKRQENVPAVRKDSLPSVAAKEQRSVVKYRESGIPAKKGKNEVAIRKDNLPAKPSSSTPRTFGDKGSGSRLGTNLKRAGAAAAVAGATYGLYKGADEPRAGGGMRLVEKKEAPRDDRASSKSDKAAAFKALQQGMKTPGSPTNPNKAVAKKTGDKSRLAKPEKKFSNFERMKQRQYEKEGFGGRSMTSSRAKERVKTERGFKFKDLFKKK